MLLALAVISCSENEESRYTLSGKASDTQSTLYIFGTDNRYESIDSITSNNAGEFVFSIKVDTVVPLMLILPDGELVPVYAEPNVEAHIMRDKKMNNGWRIDGGITQALHDSISRELDACRSYDQKLKMISTFIESHPISDVCIEIIRRYAVDVQSPKMDKIRACISEMGGVMQDQEYLNAVKKKCEHKRSNVISRSFPNFRYTTVDGRDVSLSTYVRKYTLITFWATWDEPSRAHMQSLNKIQEEIDTTHFSILNIALDNDTAKWNECIKTDSIAGDNVCDNNAWNSKLLEEISIPSLPYSILITPYQRVNKYDVKLDKATELIDSLVRKYKKELKEKELKKKTKK